MLFTPWATATRSRAANVLSRGIVGDLNGELVVALPVYKQHFSLLTGRCIEDASVRIPVYAARVEEGWVVVEPSRHVATTCCYCGVGCGMLVSTSVEYQILAGERRSGSSRQLRPPVHQGRCAAPVHGPRPGGRLLYPEVNGERATWDEALDHLAANRFAEIIRAHGPDAVAFYISGQLLTEDYYVFNKLAKGLIGTDNVDTNSRLCMSSRGGRLQASLGTDAPPACYEDIELPTCVFIAGSNPAFAPPGPVPAASRMRGAQSGASA